MKKLILLFIVCSFNFHGYAQDPDLYQTWYLNSMSGEVFDPIYVSEIEPEITPSITITESLSFTGEGACNTFTGTINFLNPELEFQNFNNSTIDCTYESHTDLEYYSFFQTESLIFYTITTENGIQYLNLDNQIFEGLSFSNQLLSSSDHLKKSWNIFPNPVSNTLIIPSEINNIEAITIYSITGKKMLIIENKTNFIDVSNLSKGIYFMQVLTSEGKTVKKFIKK